MFLALVINLDYRDKLFEPSFVVHSRSKLQGCRAWDEINIHLNTWLVEQGITRQDSVSQCKYRDSLASADKLAKEEKLGLWQEK